MSPKHLLAFAALFAAGTLARADYQVTLSHVHLCCKGCVHDAKDAGSVAGATATPDKDARTITITADSRATAQKAVNAIVAAGFYGQASDPAIQVPTATAPDKMVSGMTVSGVEVCCNHCVSEVNKVVAKVKGVTGTTAQKGDDSFEITGNFNEREVLEALHNAGFAAQVE